MLVDVNWNGTPRKLMLWGNRNGFFYVLDRATGQFLLGKAIHEGELGERAGPKGRPILTPQPPGKPTFPGPLGATNWYSPSYSPRTGLFYLSAWENYGQVFAEGETVELQGRAELHRRQPGAAARRTARDARHAARSGQHLARRAPRTAIVMAIDPRPARGSGRSRCTTSRPAAS